MPSLPWIVRRCLQLALLFAGVAFFSLTLSAAANAAPAAGIHVDTPNGNVANVRQEPTTQAPVLRRLADGTELNATHRVRASNGKVWVQLAAGGYISADLVAGDPALPMKTITTGPAPEAKPIPKTKTPTTSTTTEAPKPEAPRPAPAAAGIHVDTPNGNVANVRQEPTTQAPVLRRLADGTELNATHRVRASNGKVWVQLAAGGYISADLVAGDPALPLREAPKAEAKPSKPAPAKAADPAPALPVQANKSGQNIQSGSAAAVVLAPAAPAIPPAVGAVAAGAAAIAAGAAWVGEGVADGVVDGAKAVAGFVSRAVGSLGMDDEDLDGRLPTPRPGTPPRPPSSEPVSPPKPATDSHPQPLPAPWATSDSHAVCQVPLKWTFAAEFHINQDHIEGGIYADPRSKGIWGVPNEQGQRPDVEASDLQPLMELANAVPGRMQASTGNCIRVNSIWPVGTKSGGDVVSDYSVVYTPVTGELKTMYPGRN